jgi:thiol-disulfide isomerase/thioredoxin
MLRKLLVVLLFAVALWARTPRPLPNLPIPMVNGKSIHLDQYRGKVVLVSIIATTCSHCIQSIAVLNRIQKEFGSKLQIVAAAGDNNAQSVVGPFIQRYRPIFPVGYLNTDQMIKLGDIPPNVRPVAPIFLFIDKKGVVRFQFYGDDPFFKSEESATRGVVRALLKE